jgi:sterol desaturase/sphingolipid hydroxylase (fatty acid hydroxylase superfamily)
MFVAGVVLLAAFLMMGVELARPGRSFPKVAHWYLRALAFNGGQAVSLFTVGTLADRYFSTHGSGLLAGLGPVSGALAGYVIHSFVYYWWHRWRHEVGFLWRIIHQLHHSPQRIEIVTSFYKHPLEIALNGVISSALLYGLLGLSAEAATGAFLISGLAELVYHWNIKTPHWLGYLIQRPESHCVHHEEGLHAFNYGDLPVFDWMFGTLRNPPQWQKTCGLGPENELRIAEMLRGVELTAKEAVPETPR